MRHTTTSADGTAIGYDLLGDGEVPLVVVAGALQGGSTYRPTARALAASFRVVNYDRRGRGASGDGPAYDVQREVEDLGALIEVVGGRAVVYGHSSGAALAMHAATAGLPIDALVLHEPPFGDGTPEEDSAAAAEADALATLLRDGRRGEALATYFGSMGLPDAEVRGLAADETMLAHAPTLLYEYELLSVEARSGRTPTDQAASIPVPTLVVAGGASPDFMLAAAHTIAAALPHGRLVVIEEHGHTPPPAVIADIVGDFVRSTTPPTTAQSHRTG